MLTTPALLFQDKLNPGERIVWVGQPQQGFLLRPGDLFFIPFSLMWSGFTLFWEYKALATGDPFFILWGLPFVAFGLYIVAGRFLVDMALRRKTYYALTTERVLILSGLFDRAIKSLDLKLLPEINLIERLDSKGSIVFGPLTSAFWWSMGAAWPAGGKQQPAAFERIENVRMVYNQIQRMRNTSDDAPV